MASVIYHKKTNTRSIQFTSGDGKRPMIRLGKLAKKATDTIAVHVAALNHAKMTNTTVPVETTRWLTAIEPKLEEKAARLSSLLEANPSMKARVLLHKSLPKS